LKRVALEAIYDGNGAVAGWKPKKTSTLRQGRSTGKPTKAQAERMDKVANGGCIACYHEFLWNSANVIAYGIGTGIGGGTEVHHLTVGGKHGQRRRGHWFTIGLCSWHHRGESHISPKVERCKIALGPSLHHHPAEFRARYGSDDYLLAWQNYLIQMPGIPMPELRQRGC